jgi:hypothetical protein
MLSKILIVSKDIKHTLLIKEGLETSFSSNNISFKFTSSINLASNYIGSSQQNIKLAVIDDSYFFNDIITFLSSIIKHFNGYFLFVGKFNNVKLESFFKEIKRNNYEVVGSIKSRIKSIESDIIKSLFSLKMKPLEKINQDSKVCNKSLVLSSLSKIEFIDHKYIMYLEADGRCTNIHLKNGSKKSSSKNLGAYTNELISSSFLRIHKRYIVNVDSIDYISKKDGLYCILKNGDNLPVSGTKKEIVTEILSRR